MKNRSWFLTRGKLFNKLRIFFGKQAPAVETKPARESDHHDDSFWLLAILYNSPCWPFVFFFLIISTALLHCSQTPNTPTSVRSLSSRQGGCDRLILTYTGTGAAEPLPSNRASWDWLVPSDVKVGTVEAETEGYFLPMSSLLVTSEWHTKGLPLPPTACPIDGKGNRPKRPLAAVITTSTAVRRATSKNSAALMKIWCYITSGLLYVRWNLEQILAADTKTDNVESHYVLCYHDNRDKRNSGQMFILQNSRF